MELDPGATRDLIRVLVADSNQTQSQLLTTALRRQQRMRVVCCRGELAHCLVALRTTPADIAVLSGDPAEHDRFLDTIRGIHREYPRLGLVLLLDSYDRDFVVKAMRAGARGLFCRASQPFRALCRCIAVVRKGEFWANTEQIGYIIEALNSRLTPKVVNTRGELLLTDREEEIVTCVAEGLTNRAVAQKVNIKANSVKKALLRIFDKLGVSNRVELVLFALAHRAESPPPARPRACVSFLPTEVSNLREISSPEKNGRHSIRESR